MKKQKIYFLPIVFLLGIIILTWYLFFHEKLVDDNEKRIAGIIALLGSGFAAFQFWINEINTEKRKLFDLRYDTYKEFILLINSISETLNTEMYSADSISVHSLVSKLMNQINSLSSTINMNNDYLFSKLHLRNETKVIEDIMEKILKRTDEFRLSIESANKNTKEFMKSIERMNWHNDIRINLKELHNRKYDFYKTLREYL